ncbi:hypothetical protein DCO57_21495 [Labrenzia sp. 011]|nr:hypothetical protein DCO57_21495 [Labrenzia sp. 011]
MPCFYWIFSDFIQIKPDKVFILVGDFQRQETPDELKRVIDVGIEVGDNTVPMRKAIARFHQRREHWGKVIFTIK